MVSDAREFRALPIQLTQGWTYTRHLFIRPHDSQAASGTAASQQGCCLFVAGLPYTHEDTERVVSELFGSFGPVSSVALHASQTAAIVTFTQHSSVKKVMAAAQAACPVQLRMRQPEQPYGLKGWVEAQKACFPGAGLLRQQLDAWTEEFEGAEARRRESAAASLAEDGWTVVKRRGGGKRASDGATAVGGVALAAAQAFAAGKKERKALDFYRFQQRDKRRNELVELRQKFAEDTRRIAELKASRKFKA